MNQPEKLVVSKTSGRQLLPAGLGCRPATLDIGESPARINQAVKMRVNNLARIHLKDARKVTPVEAPIEIPGLAQS